MTPEMLIAHHRSDRLNQKLHFRQRRDRASVTLRNSIPRFGQKITLSDRISTGLFCESQNVAAIQRRCAGSCSVSSFTEAGCQLNRNTQTLDSKNRIAAPKSVFRRASMQDVTQILKQIETDDPFAMARLCSSSIRSCESGGVVGFSGCQYLKDSLDHDARREFARQLILLVRVLSISD